ncbi:MAG: hypothetical protein QG588_2367, partial [Candidatus Poribacteria bacterium]|nr:hypothetical protein [Candidatus Poribacteria bacterium]
MLFIEMGMDGAVRKEN